MSVALRRFCLSYGSACESRFSSLPALAAAYSALSAAAESASISSTISNGLKRRITTPSTTNLRSATNLHPRTTHIARAAAHYQMQAAAHTVIIHRPSLPYGLGQHNLPLSPLR